MAIKISGSTIIDDSRNIVNAGVVTATSYYGDGSNLTGIGGSITNIIHVTKDGNDSNSGAVPNEAKATIAAAVGIATDGSVIKVSAGVYVENNPIVVPKQVSIVGDSLREITISPQNADKDLFHVAPGVMLQELTFSGTVNEGIAAVAFNPDKIQYNAQSPYIRFCTNRIVNSIGMKVDGSKSIGPFKSMVTDSYTQYNSNGIGVSVSNEGYAQIVSMFTMNLDTGITCISGGQCDVTNSNSSFGNYGMVSDGVSLRKYTGTVSAAAEANSDSFKLDLNVPTLSISNATYGENSGIVTLTTYTPHQLSVGMGVTLSKLGFTCSYGDYTHQFVESNPNSITANSGGPFTPSDATYNPNTGNLVLTIGSGHGLTANTTLTASNSGGLTTYTPTTGVLKIKTTANHGLSNGDKIKFVQESLRFTCSKDSNATNHDYPRITDPMYNKWLTVTVVNADEFTVNVGTSENFTHTFVQSVTNDNILKATNTINIATNSLSFKCSKDSYATTHTYPRSTDPAYNATLGVEAVSSDSITINVGVSTHDIFPTGINGNVFEVKDVLSANQFTTYVGPNRFPHTYVSGGSAKIDVIRPFDGQVVYFDSLYKSVDYITITNGGSGYTSAPTITIDAPSESWGIKATANSEITNGILTKINIVSSGRCYTSVPSITVSGSATASLTTKPDYYVITESTPISSGISTITVSENVPYAVGIGSTVPFFKQSRILASSHSFQYIGSGVELVDALPSRGGVAIQENEIYDKNGGLTIFTSTDQTGNFRIGDGVVINQQTGTVSGDSYSKSLFSTMTPFILALGGD